jgi:hypothetical protein
VTLVDLSTQALLAALVTTLQPLQLLNVLVVMVVEEQLVVAGQHIK